MTFDIEAMRRNRDAGTPGEWFVAGVRVKMDKQQWLAISRYDEANKRDENICCVGYDPKTGLGSVDARRIASVPSMEAEIERLTARVAELEGALGYCVAAIEHADMSDGVCCCGDNMEGHSSPMDCGHSPTDMGEHHAYQVLSLARAALSTPTEDQPK